MIGLTIVAALLLAQVGDVDPSASGWTLDGIAKVGLGVASFFALCGGGGYLLKRLLDELKDSRMVFRDLLKDERDTHRAENHLLSQEQRENTDRIIDAINQSALFQGVANGRDRERGSRG